MFKYLIFFVSMAFSCFSYEVPSYSCKDLGTLGADSSSALSINNKNQVFGILSYNNESQNFLWSEEDGLQILEIPYCEGLLNDKGQIAGVSSRVKDSTTADLWIWDQNEGMMIVGSYVDASVRLKKFNNRGDVLFHVYPFALGLVGGLPDTHKNQKYYFWDNEKKVLINLTDTFQAQFEGASFQAEAMNNIGEVAILSNSGSYLWRDNKFEKLFLGFDVNTAHQILEIDDKGNVILTTHTFSHAKVFFVNTSKQITREIHGQFFSGGDFVIRNECPILLGCTPSILKKDLRGVCYYTPGADINNITVLGNIWKGGVSIKDQNDNGYAIGTGGTVFYQQTHAVLLVPERP